MDNQNNPILKRVSRLGEMLKEHWQPKPITPPTVDPQLELLTGVQRSAEVIRHSILSFEYWVSPLGRLREWVRLNSKLSAILLVPAVILLPIILLVTAQVLQWLVLLISITGKLILFPVVALIAASVLALVISLLRTLLGK